MKNIYLTSGTINEVFNELETSYKGVLNSTDNEFKLALDTDFIKGNIDGVTFINGITSIQVSLTFFEDTLLSIEPVSNHLFYLRIAMKALFNTVMAFLDINQR